MINNMNKVLQFYDYERCFKHYTQRIMNLRQARIHGEVIMAKPVLLLAVIDSVENGEVLSNNIRLTESQEQRYLTLMRQYVKGSQFDKPTPIATPYFHLQGDGFWHLTWKPGKEPPEGSPSFRYICDNCVRTSVDDDLWTLLEHRMMRLRLRDYIITHKLGDSKDMSYELDSFNDIQIAAEDSSHNYGMGLAA